MTMKIKRRCETLKSYLRIRTSKVIHIPLPSPPPYFIGSPHPLLDVYHLMKEMNLSLKSACFPINLPPNWINIVDTTANASVTRVRPSRVNLKVMRRRSADNYLLDRQTWEGLRSDVKTSNLDFNQKNVLKQTFWHINRQFFYVLRSKIAQQINFST